MADDELSSQHILVVNAGSSTVKFAAFDCQQMDAVYRGILDLQGTGKTLFRVSWNGNTHEENLSQGNKQLDITPVIQWLNQNGLLDHLVAIGHRVAHGGSTFAEPVIINREVKQAIQRCVRFAPLHNPSNLRGIEMFESHLPDLPQVAIFDTAFHQTLPEHAYLYPLPYEYFTEHGVRRYGFHGTSHHYVAQQAARWLNLEWENSAFISLHLGNGSSAAAILNGKSVDTTMGLTPLEGLMMGTRCGDIDPGLHEFLCHQLNYSIEEVTKLLYKQSGLLGVSQHSSDMRTLQQAAQEGNPQAELAITLFCYRAAKASAQMLVALPTLNGLIFTGGIGEHSSLVRERILNFLPFLNFQLDEQANGSHGVHSENSTAVRGVIAQSNDSVAMVVPTNEERSIAQQTLELIR